MNRFSGFSPPLQVIGFVATRASDPERGPMIRMRPDDAIIRLVSNGELVRVLTPRRAELAVLQIDETLPRGGVVLRDVIEHLDATADSLKNVMDFLKPGGFLYVVFPPYYSPFGGHQHALANTWGKLPFIHYLPKALWDPMIASGRKLDIEEVNRLRAIRLTISRFRKAAKSVGYRIVDEELFFLRPVFKMKFGLPTVKVNLVKHLPLLREVAALEASYLLQKPLA